MRLSLFPGAHNVSFAAWHDFVHGSVYLTLFWRSVRMSLTVSVVVVLFAYPLAYFLALSGTKRKYVLLLVLIAPFLTSSLLRVLAWKVILGLEWSAQQPALLDRAPVARPPDLPAPLQQVRGDAGAGLRLAAVRGAPDLRLAREPRSPAARGGERPRRQPVPGVPQDHAAVEPPGVAAAFMFVFIPTVGEFVTPSLVGGVSGYMYGNQIVDLFGAGLDWQTGWPRSSCSSWSWR